MRVSALSLLLALSLASGAFPVWAVPEAPPSATTAHLETLSGAVPLELEVPAGYEVQTEHDHTLDVFHVWRSPPPPLPRDTSLAVIVSRVRTPFCVPGAGHTEPAAFPAWKLTWHICREEGAHATVWETFVAAPAQHRVVQITLIGTDTAELKRLRAIAETLRPAGG